jgi:hypothetical protein
MGVLVAQDRASRPYDAGERQAIGGRPARDGMDANLALENVAEFLFEARGFFSRRALTASSP